MKTLLLVSLFYCCHALNVTITRQSGHKHDRLVFDTCDTSVCAFYNADFYAKYGNQVECRCRGSDVFFSLSEEKLQCQTQNKGKNTGEIYYMSNSVKGDSFFIIDQTRFDIETKIIKGSS